uniref:Uncharacterized protein n=1 Tax=Panagrolaimus davidi TaxID=227884 RepID=A0A914PZP0_9BILA
MHFVFVVVAFILIFFEYGNGFTLEGIPVEGSTQIYGGCHKFIGKIYCENGATILSRARVKLWEADNKFLNDGDDFIAIASIARDGTFLIDTCFYDRFTFIKLGDAQVYLEFQNACRRNDFYYGRLAKPGKFLYYEIPKIGHEISVVYSE